MTKVAILIPCCNEVQTIFDVVTSFKEYLPDSTIYVYDNCSNDGTAVVAKQAGALVRYARKIGKGNVVRKMFSDIDADIYVMVDGDGTYDASDAVKMVEMLNSDSLDMVVAVRKAQAEGAYPGGHKFGNILFNFIFKILFGSTFNDVFSGYRVFSKRFVKTFPIISDGFDIEAELSIHTCALELPFAEIDSNYFERPKNSFSKLKTFSDGFKILWRIIRLLKETRPLFVFGMISLFLFLLSVGIAVPVILTFIETGLVPRLPTAVLSVGIMLISFLSLTCGIILNGITQARMEIKKLNYLRF